MICQNVSNLLKNICSNSWCTLRLRYQFPNKNVASVNVLWFCRPDWCWWDSGQIVREAKTSKTRKRSAIWIDCCTLCYGCAVLGRHGRRNSLQHADLKTAIRMMTKTMPVIIQWQEENNRWYCVHQLLQPVPKMPYTELWNKIALRTAAMQNNNRNL